MLFRGGAGLGTPESLPVSAEMVLMFTWVHGLAFVALGGLVAFVVAATIFAAPVLRLLSPWSVLVANLLAAAAMTAYFRRCHPGLRVEP